MLVDSNLARMNEEIARLTDGEVTKVTQAARIIKFVAPVLAYHSEAYNYLVKYKAKEDSDGKEIRPEKLSISRDRLEQVVNFLDSFKGELNDGEKAVRDLLELRHYGGSATPGKFLKTLNMSVNGRLCGQFVFNGAPQTGRMSSRGVQVHNLMRAHLGELEDTAINAILDLVDERIGRRLVAAGY